MGSEGQHKHEDLPKRILEHPDVRGPCLRILLFFVLSWGQPQALKHCEQLSLAISTCLRSVKVTKALEQFISPTYTAGALGFELGKLMWKVGHS